MDLIDNYKNNFEIKIKTELNSYQNEYEELNDKKINQEYINKSVKTICEIAFQDFSNVVNEYGDPNTWENDTFREYIFNFSDIYTKYPIDEDHDDNDKYASDEEKPQPVKRISSTKFVDVSSKCVGKTF